MTKDPARRTIECRDGKGRPGRLSILAESNVVLIATPPGEVAYLDPAVIDEVKNALNEARVEATRSRR